MAKPFLTPRGLAERWSLTRATLKHWRWSGKGPHYVKINGGIRYYIEEIEKFEKERRRSHTSMTEYIESNAS